MLIKHGVEETDDKEIIIRHGGRILDAKHYLRSARSSPGTLTSGTGRTLRGVRRN